MKKESPNPEAMPPELALMHAESKRLQAEMEALNERYMPQRDAWVVEQLERRCTAVSLAAALGVSSITGSAVYKKWLQAEKKRADVRREFAAVEEAIKAGINYDPRLGVGFIVAVGSGSVFDDTFREEFWEVSKEVGNALLAKRNLRTRYVGKMPSTESRKPADQFWANFLVTDSGVV